MRKISYILPFLFFLVSCAPSIMLDRGPALPSQLQGKVTVLASDDPAYAGADVSAAVKPEGQGGVSAALVVRLEQDMPVYRMWNGPDKVDANGYTNRMGQWWAFDAPAGTREEYRTHYEICQAWNNLTWVATCHLKQGSVVAIGPGQSVSAETCGDPTGQEAYAANPVNWQVWIVKAWARGNELVCPPDGDDYEADPQDVSQPGTP